MSLCSTESAPRSNRSSSSGDLPDTLERPELESNRARAGRDHGPTLPAVPNEPSFDALDIARPHLRDVTPYTSARDEFTGTAHVYLDANENPFGSVAGQALNRYPDPHARAVKAKLGALLGVAPDSLFVGNGSDEAIDLLVHAFCETRSRSRHHHASDLRDVRRHGGRQQRGRARGAARR